ncbi:MAG: DAK2 domain-containing protein [Clostridiales bacterium]|nr:DAK2 domain-containing protein [Clostridiales bacterium]
MIDAKEFKRRMEGALKGLSLNKDYINSLNVFPVPDGDTGSNMLATLERAIAEVRKCGDDQSVSALAEAAAFGSLMGARGNSGVILSQLFRGFADGCKGKVELGIKDLAYAIDSAVKKAYRAVNKPVEGTMLTVAREIAYRSKNLSTETDLDSFLNEILKAAKEASAKTPTMLKILRDAGVVDAGGEGLAAMIKGMLDSANIEGVEVGGTPARPEYYNEDLKYTYCTELIINSSEDKVAYLKGRLSRLGDSMIVAGSGDIIKVHIHTNEPGKVIDISKGLGELYDIKIDNMRRQHRETLFQERKPYGFVIVAEGNGFIETYSSIDNVSVVKGGITSNPSVEELKSASEGLYAREVYIFPGNKNVIMTAQKVKELADIPIYVIPTRTIPEAAVALSAFDPTIDSSFNESEMLKALQGVTVGGVAVASKDVNMNGFNLQKGDYLAVIGDDVVGQADSDKEALFLLLDKMIDGGESLVTIYRSQKEEDNDIVQETNKRFPGVEIAFEYGGQPLYDYLVCKEN